MGKVGNWLGGAMGEDGSAICDWTWDDNKLFELALAVVDEGSPNWWEAVASMVGNKSAGEVERHYDILLEDLKFIESGKLDYLFGEAFDGKGALCYTEEGQK